VRRWFHITNLQKRSDGLWNLGVETVWWGNHRGGQPKLYRFENYTQDSNKPRELSYIIAPGSWAVDVRHALGPTLTYAGATPEERTIVLAPFQQSDTAFEAGDPICQPPGPTAWTPMGFRARYFGQLPCLMAGAAYGANNFGVTTVGAAFDVSGIGLGQTIEQIEKGQKDGVMPWGAALSVTAATSYAINIAGPVKYSAMALHSEDGNRKDIRWQCQGGGAAIYAQPKGGDLVLETSGSVSLGLKGTVQQAGLSGSNVPAKNLRGINVAVGAGAKELAVKFAVAEADANYAVMTECNWMTMKAVVEKSPSGFKVVFDKEAPADGKLDWLIVR
jgi:hypothetical protein